MDDNMRSYIRPGLVYFMAYPFAMTGEGDIANTIYDLCKDTYFDVLEITKINDAHTRNTVKKYATESGTTLTYGAQPQLMRNNENINSLDEDLRMRAIGRMKNCIDEAYEMGAKGFAFLAGPYEESTKEESYKALVSSTKELCDYAKQKGDMQVNVEVFDYDVEKCSLIGPAPLAARFAAEITAYTDNFGLMVDLSHIVQLRESLAENLEPIAPYIKHAHIANCVLAEGMDAYGDQHPRFGFDCGLVGATEVAAFLQKLLSIGYLKKGQPQIVSFEVKPWADEDPAMVIAGAKRILDKAWAML